MARTRIKPTDELFEAKVTSARYIDEHGTEDAWELDALEPTVLRDLIREQVAEHWNEDIFEREQKHAQRRQRQLRSMMRDPDWFGGVLGSDDDDPDGGDEGGEVPDLFDDMDDDEEGEE